MVRATLSWPRVWLKGSVTRESLVSKTFRFKQVAEAWRTAYRSDSIKNLIEASKDRFHMMSLLGELRARGSIDDGPDILKIKYKLCYHKCWGEAARRPDKRHVAVIDMLCKTLDL